MYGYLWCPVYHVSGLPWYYCTSSICPFVHFSISHRLSICPFVHLSICPFCARIKHARGRNNLTQQSHDNNHNQRQHPAPSCPMRHRSRTQSRDADDEQGEEFLYGIRSSRDRTTYEHRETSALTPCQFMDQATYYSYSQSWLDIAFNIVEVTEGVASFFLRYINLS